jgi:hypothetical protein
LSCRLRKGLHGHQGDTGGQRRYGAGSLKAAHVLLFPKLAISSDPRAPANADAPTDLAMRRQSLVSWSPFGSPRRDADDGDKAQQITRVDLPQIHKFTIYIN